MCVVEACIDIDNSQGLKICSEVDPDYRRTIGILTKLDMVSPGNEKDVVQILKNNNEKYQLKHGWVGVINKNQAENNEKMSIKMAKQNEEKRLGESEFWSSCENTGSRFLEEYLSEILKSFVLEFMPGFINSLENEQRDRREEYEKFTKENENLKSPSMMLFKIGKNILSMIKYGLYGTTDNCIHALARPTRAKIDSLVKDYKTCVTETLKKEIDNRIQDHEARRDSLTETLEQFNDESSGIDPRIFPADELLKKMLRREFPIIVEEPIQNATDASEKFLLKLLQIAIVENLRAYPNLKNRIHTKLRLQVQKMKADLDRDCFVFVQKHKSFFQPDIITLIQDDEKPSFISLDQSFIGSG